VAGTVRTAGFATWLFSVFLSVAFLAIFTGLAALDQVLTVRQQLAQALMTALKSATAAGATVVGPSVVWNAAAADQAAAQAITAALPVQWTGTQATAGGAVLTFSPTPAAPPIWAGPLVVGPLETSATAGSATVNGRATAVPGAFIAATLRVPVTIRWAGVPLTAPVQLGAVYQIYSYNGQAFIPVP
jgi:hypothetical protein